MPHAISNQRLRQAREQRRWTQELVAERIGASALSVLRWERGQTYPTAFYRHALCDLFGLSLEDLGLAERGNAQDATITPPFPSMPPPRMALIGRATEHRAIQEALCAHHQPVVALVGLPGVGKTALAQALAHDPAVRQAFPAGVLWAGLGPQPPVHAKLGEWASALGITESDLTKATTIEQLARAVHARIGQQRFLLVIDDAWDVTHALALRVGGPGCATLLTTRLPHLATQFAEDAPMVVGELDDADGLTLLRMLAPMAVAQEPEAAGLLAQAVGGLPLALCLVGHALRGAAIGEQPRRISAAFEDLRQVAVRMRLAMPIAAITRPPSLAQDTPLSLAAMIAASEAILAPPAQAVFRHLGVFPAKPATFAEEAAFAVCDLASEAFLMAFDALVDAGLVECVAAGRYTLHQTIVDYLHVQGIPDSAWHRLSAYIDSLLDHAANDYARLDRDLPMILVGLEQMAAHGQHEQFCTGVVKLGRFLRARGALDLYAQLVERGLACDDGYEQAKWHAALLVERAQIARLRGDYATLQSTAQEAERLARAQGAIDHLVDALHLLGLAALIHGESLLAEHYLNESLGLARQHQQREALVAVLISLGGLAARRGQLMSAQKYYEEARCLGQAEAMPEAEATALEGLGALAGVHGDLAAAEGYLTQALVSMRALQHRERQCGILSNLASAAISRTDFAGAEVHLQEALTLAHALGQQERICAVLINLVATYAGMRDFLRMDGYLTEGLAIARALGHFERLCGLLHKAGAARLAQGRLPEAHALLDEGIAHAREADYRWILGELLCTKGEVSMRQAHYKDAEMLLHEALAFAQTLTAQELTMRSQYLLAQLAVFQGRRKDAQAAISASIDTAQAIEHASLKELLAWQTAHNFLLLP